MGGEEQEARGAVEAFFVARPKTSDGGRDRQVNFARDFNALPAHVEESDGLDGDAAKSKAFGVLLPTEAERGDDARAGDDDT